MNKKYLRLSVAVVTTVFCALWSHAATYDKEAATVVWPMTDASDMAAHTATPGDVFSTVALNLGDIALSGTGTGQATYPDGSKVTFVKLRPSGSTQAVEWVVKPATGLTFTPTRISAYIARFATDAENGITITAKAGNGSTVNLGNFTAPRYNRTQSEDKYGGNSNYTNQFVITLTEAQQAALTSADALSVTGTVGVGSTKEGAYAQMTIEGYVSGTMADVEKFSLAVAASPAEGGSVGVYPVSDVYEEGSEVTLTAEKNFGYAFVNWTNAAGDVVSEEPRFKYTVTANETLTANFDRVATHELSFAVDGTNDYMVSISPAPTMLDGRMMYEEGQAVQLEANQYEGLVTFTNWSDGDTNSSKLVSMTGDMMLTAFYAEADIIAGWDFYVAGGSGRKADFAAQDNEADALTLVNTETGDVSGWLDKSTEAAGGYESLAGAAVNWRTGSQNGDVGNWHWQTRVNAEAFTDIKVQFKMLYNYNAYQTYDVEYSLDGADWHRVGSISMVKAKTVASFTGQLPSAADNQPSLYIRMRADKSSKVDGTASANDGNALAMLFITGTPRLVDDGKAPVLVASVPVDGATGASATGKIVLTFDERVKVDENHGWAILNNMDAIEADPDVANAVGLAPSANGKSVTYEYKGLEYGTRYRVTIPGGTISDLTGNTVTDDIVIGFTTMVRPAIEKRMYDFIVPDDGTFAQALEAAAARTDKAQRYRIFVKQGDYVIAAKGTEFVHDGKTYAYPDPRTYFNTPNVSIVGESAANTSITNQMPNSLTNNPDAGKGGQANPVEGIRTSGVLYLQSGAQDTYLQDIKLWSATADGTGRNVVLVDGGNRNVFKNVTLWAYQDTYVPDNARGLTYYEGGVVRGRTDFICGSGDVFFNHTELVMCEEGGFISVPRGNVKYGFVYKDCVISGGTGKVDGNYYLGRAWTSDAESYFIDTRMNAVPRAEGWSDWNTGPTRFAEYNSRTSSGSAVDLSSRKKLFASSNTANEPVLTAEEALEIGNLHNMFGDWDPTLLTEQAPTPTAVELDKSTGKLTWNGSNYALLYAIVKDGRVVDFTLDNTYDVDDVEARWGVRAANEMGGLGETATASISTGIVEATGAEPAQTPHTYNMQGMRVGKAVRGVYIVGGKKVVIK